MPRFLIPQPAEGTLAALGDALDVVDFGIALLNQDLRPYFTNRRFDEIWDIPPEVMAATPTFGELLAGAAQRGWYDMPAADLPEYLAEREAEVLAGATQPAIIQLTDGRHILFCCGVCRDGGRILTYADISRELREEPNHAAARANAEMRFTSEVLEDQAAHLATLAEAAEENAQKAEHARRLLESEVAERRMLEARLRRMATIDGLTGALNRVEFLASAQRALEAAGTSGQTLVVFMLDVDHFKAVNDRFGHAGGDCALQHLVTTLSAGIRQIDLLGRMGGEEFAIALPNMPVTAAESVAERMRARVAEAPVPFGDKRIPITVSIGVAVQHDTDRSIEQIIARADAALYSAKGSGRNRVVRYQRPRPRDIAGS